MAKTTGTLYGGITVPKFKKKENRLYGDLLGKQLGYVGQAATYYDDPSNLTADYWRNWGQGQQGDTMGWQLEDMTGDPGARAAYELKQRNMGNQGFNQLLQSVYSPSGIAEWAKQRAGLYGPETLSALQLLPTGYKPPSPKGQGSFINQALGVASTAAGMGWTPFQRK